jgi:alkanesulfonate monooxygenase SsuD/methylene tetrahydromethanopterin reductase-like flavin-dependent oxidoreductase (luciferase family)
VQLSTVILPCDRWVTMKPIWQRAEELGFHAAYTYDHLAWNRLRDWPWFGAVPTLVAAATATSTIRLGTMVTSPNFRHPVPLAKDLLSLDDVSCGRLVVGVGSGGLGLDSSVLGNEPWSARERSGRFVEFVDLLDQLLRDPLTSYDGRFYKANEARMRPGPVQLPRPTLYVAAEGPNGIDFAAQRADGWITLGRSSAPQATMQEVVSSQMARLSVALERYRVEPSTFARLLLLGVNEVPTFGAVGTLSTLVDQYHEIGITEIVVHWPIPDSPFDVDLGLFEDSVAAAMERCAEYAS